MSMNHIIGILVLISLTTQKWFLERNHGKRKILGESLGSENWTWRIAKILVGKLISLNNCKEWLLLSQIRDSVVVLRDRIYKELGHTIDPNQFMIKLGKHSKSINCRGEQGSCSVDWLIRVVTSYEKAIRSRVSSNQNYNDIKCLVCQS